MAGECDEELCQYWGGDGHVCNCALFDIDPGEDRWGGASFHRCGECSPYCRGEESDG